MLVYEDDVRVGIITRNSENVKTGPMDQLWILHRHTSPLDAARSGADATVCGSCPHRRYHGSLGSCYVNLGHAPNNIWQKYAAGKYPLASLEEAVRAQRGRPIRLGAYGDPAFLPWDLVWPLARSSSLAPGYTHQWLDIDTRWALVLMASVDSEKHAAAARALGYRTFRTTPSSAPPDLTETMCPASAEARTRTGRTVTCLDCGACGGHLVRGRRNIVIRSHGSFLTARTTRLTVNRNEEFSYAND